MHTRSLSCRCNSAFVKRRPASGGLAPWQLTAGPKSAGLLEGVEAPVRNGGHTLLRCAKPALPSSAHSSFAESCCKFKAYFFKTITTDRSAHVKHTLAQRWPPRSKRRYARLYTLISSEVDGFRLRQFSSNPGLNLRWCCVLVVRQELDTEEVVYMEALMAGYKYME